MRHRFLGRWVAILATAALVAAACGGEDLEPPATSVPAPTTTTVRADTPATGAAPAEALVEIERVVALRGEEFDPATTPPLGDFDVARLAEATKTLDPAAVCPPLEFPESLEGVAEILRIEAGCVVVEYVPLEGRTVGEVRAELFSSDPTVHAVGLPLVDLQVNALQGSGYDGPPPPPYDEDDYKAGEWWHLDMLDAALLWDPDGWHYTDSSGNRRHISGWPRDANVIVAVVDTSVFIHQDFVGRVVGSGGKKEIDWLDDDCHHEGLNKHGTHVAGLIAAVQGNRYATAGIAPRAKILPINLVGDECDSLIPSGGYTATNAIYAAIRREVDVINMSFRSKREAFHDEFSFDAKIYAGNDAFEGMLRVAQNLDIMTIASAGNCGGSYFSRQEEGCATQDMQQVPALYYGVVAVAAIAKDGERAGFSTSNSDVDIAAPGDRLLSTRAQWCLAIILCTGVSKTESGTSMAAPLVSGVVAHMKARYPQATYSQMAMALFSTAVHPTGEPPGWMTHEYGFGVVQPKAAIEELDEILRRDSAPPTTVTPPTTTLPAAPGSVTLAVGGSAQGWQDCRSEHCKHLSISLDAPAGEYDVECWSSRDTTPWYADTWNWPPSTLWTEGGCWFGYPGEQVWVVVGGTKSNVIAWGHNDSGQTDAPADSSPLAVSPRRSIYGVSYNEPRPLAFHRERFTDEVLDPPRVEEWRYDDLEFVWQQYGNAAPFLDVVRAGAGFASGFSIAIHQGRQIDSLIRDLMEYVLEDSMSIDVTRVEGATRAVRVSWLSLSGDVSAVSIYAEAGDMTVEIATRYFWQEQVGSDVVKKLAPLLESISIDSTKFPRR